MTSDTALSRWARQRPESPFVFYRGQRGHFEWLSFAAASTLRAPGSAAGKSLPRDVEEFLDLARRVGAEEDTGVDVA